MTPQATSSSSLHQGQTSDLAPATHRRRTVVRASEFVFDSLIVIPLGCLAGLLWANTQPDSYFVAAHVLAFPINDIGMAFFLALVAKEGVEATLPGGALHSWRRAALPIAAAVGGAIAPIACYALYLRYVSEWMLMSGWIVPSAVDIAASFVVARAIFGRHPAVPFLLLFALASNGIGLVALAVSHPMGDMHIAVALALIALAIASAVWMRRRRVRTFWPYVIVPGGLAWAGLYLGGIHPALALVPIVPFMPHARRDPGLFVEPETPPRSTLARFGHWWTPPVQLVLLGFGLVNAGVPLRGLEAGTLAVPLASIVGRPIGVLAAAALAIAAGLHLPQRVGWRELVVIGLVSSMGLTMALFFAAIALPIGPLLHEARMGGLLTLAGGPVAVAAAWLLGVGRFKRREP